VSGDLTGWIERLFRDQELTGMGHAQRVDDTNLGLGWIYYGLARLVRLQRVVVIGSWRGFAPLVFGRALADNAEGGRVVFIDPSQVDDFWSDPERVASHTATHGLANIDHYCMTTQQFVTTEAWRALSDVGIVLVDGYHTEEQARFDHQAFAAKLGTGGYALFHDSVRERVSRIYGDHRHYTHTVKRYIDNLRADPTWQVLDLPFGDGLTIVRRTGDDT
jgi:predicted O-methyltransferase YrrM